MPVTSSGAALNLVRETESVSFRPPVREQSDNTTPAVQAPATDASATQDDVLVVSNVARLLGDLSTSESAAPKNEAEIEEDQRKSHERTAKRLEEYLNSGTTVRFQVVIGNVGDEDAKSINQALRFQVINKENGKVLISFPPEEVSKLQSKPPGGTGIVLDQAV